MNNNTLPSVVEHARSITLAEAARSGLQRLGLPPTPRNYQIWYIYATSHNRALNAAIDGMLAGGIPTDTELDALHERFFGNAGALERPLPGARRDPQMNRGGAEA